MTKAYEYNKVWRQRHPNTRYSGKKRYYTKTQGARNTGNPWTENENKQVLAREVADTELAKMLGRSVSAIQHQRYNLKKIERKTSDAGTN